MKTIKEIEELINTITKVKDYWGDKVNLEEYESVFKSILTHRLEHCAAQLEEHLKDAFKSPMGLMISWEGGHFSKPVYESIVEALNQTMMEWNTLIWEQILRQLFDENNRDKNLFYFASEMLLCGERE